MKSLYKTIVTLCTAGALMLPSGTSKTAAAEKTSFEAVTANLDSNGHLYAYMNTAKIMKQLDQMVDGLLEFAQGDDPNNPLTNNPLFGPMIANITGAIKPAYEESGLNQIGGLGMSSFAVKTNLWRSKIYAHRNSQEGEGLIWKMFGSNPHKLDVLELTPETAGILAHTDLDLDALLDWGDRISEKVSGGQTMTASMPGEVKDILNTFDGEIGFMLALDPEKQVTFPGFMFQMNEDIKMDSFSFAMLLRAKDDTLLTMINDTMAVGLAPPQKTKVGSTTIQSISLPLPIPIPGLDISPCYFQVGDYMVIASSTALGKSIIEAKDGKGRLTDNDEFKTITNGLDLNANGISYASAGATEWGMKVNELSMGQLPEELKTTMQIYLDYSKQMKGMVSLLKSEKDGVMLETHSSVNLFGEYMVHTLASIAIMVGNSLQQLNDTGMFEDLGGFDEDHGAFNEGPPQNFNFDDEPAAVNNVELFE